MHTKKYLPPIAITVGEPAGIGTEVSLRAALEWQKKNDYPLILIGDYAHIKSTAKTIGLDAVFDLNDSATHQENRLHVCHIALHTPVIFGQLDVMNAPYVLQLLDRAVDGILAKKFSAMVTAPIQKSIINESKNITKKFTGHTEYLAQRTNAEQVVMMLAGAGMRVALATTHIPISLVSKAITTNKLNKTIAIILSDLQLKFGIKHPRLLVAGLNPHAGESGHMGDEEVKIISPIINDFQNQGFDVRGPYPADTLFQPRYLTDCDAVLAMYHDQGLPVLKYASFGHGVNITLGLPIIRTSVDHGTALDLAGKNCADSGSMFAAIECAYQMVINQSDI